MSTLSPQAYHKIKYYEYNGYLHDQISNKYNSKGKLLETYSTNTGIKENYTYNENGFLIQIKRTKGNNLNFNCFYKNNAKGKPIEAKWYDNTNKLTQTQTFKYDDNNNLTEETRCNANNSISIKFIITYKYDNNNWIEKNVQKINYPGETLDYQSYVIVRKIEYF